MAKAWVGRDSRGRLNVFGEAVIGDKRVRRRKVIPGNDEQFASKVTAELNARFLTDDLSWFKRSRPTPRSRSRSHKSIPTLAEWREVWIEELRGQIGEHTWRSYRSSTADLVKRLGTFRLDQIGVSHLLELRSKLARDGLAHPTVKDRLGHLKMMSAA